MSKKKVVRKRAKIKIRSFELRCQTCKSALHFDNKYTWNEAEFPEATEIMCECGTICTISYKEMNALFL